MSRGTLEPTYADRAQRLRAWDANMLAWARPEQAWWAATLRLIRRLRGEFGNA